MMNDLKPLSEFTMQELTAMRDLSFSYWVELSNSCRETLERYNSINIEINRRLGLPPDTKKA